MASAAVPLPCFAAEGQIAPANILPPYPVLIHGAAVAKNSGGPPNGSSAKPVAKSRSVAAVDSAVPNHWSRLAPLSGNDAVARLLMHPLLRLAAAPAPAQAAAAAPTAPAPTQKPSGAPSQSTTPAPAAAPAIQPAAAGGNAVGASISSTIIQVVPNSQMHMEPEATVPAGPMDIAPPPAPATVNEPAATGGTLNTAPMPSGMTGAGPIEAPRTASGLVAPALRVPPPPELLPQPVPDVPAGAGLGGPGTATMVINLDQAVSLGLQNETDISIAQQGVLLAQGKVRVAAAGLKPSVTAAGNLSTSNTFSTVNNGSLVNPGTTVNNVSSNGFNRTYSAGLTLSQLIYDNGHTRSSVKSAEAAEAASMANTTAARQQVVFNIKQAYFGLLEAEGLVEADRGTVAAQRTHLDEALAVYAAGTSAQSDVIQAQTNLAEALLALANAQNSEAIARVNLNLTLGLDPRNPTAVADTGAESATIPALNDLVSQTLSARPDIIVQQQTLLSDQFSLRVARTNNSPVVDADGTVGVEGGSESDRNSSLGAGVSATWPFFDSGLTKGLVEQAQANVNTAQLQLQALLRTAASDVTQAYLNVANARQRILTSNAEVANAQEALRLAEGQYRAGVAIFLQVTDAQAALATALADQVTATYGLNSSLANLDFAVHGGHSAPNNGSSASLYTSTIPSTASTTTTTISAGSGSGTTAISTTTTGTSTTP